MTPDPFRIHNAGVRRAREAYRLATKCDDCGDFSPLHRIRCAPCQRAADNHATAAKRRNRKDIA